MRKINSAGSITISNPDINISEVGGNTMNTGAGNVGTGTQRITLATNDPAVTSLEVIDDWDSNNRAKVSPISGQDGVAAGSGTIDALTQRMTIATDDTLLSLLKSLPIVYGEPYLSPQDFSVAYTSNVTLTVTGAPFDVDDTVNYTASIIVKNVSGVVTKYYNGHNGVSISASSNVITISGAETNGYYFTFNSNEALQLIRSTVGGASALFITNTAYFQNNTWYRIKITRTTAGVFSVYIKGGTFGSNYVLVSTSGGSGTNPITDTTYSSSNYFVLDLDQNDKIANISIYNQISV